MAAEPQAPDAAAGRSGPGHGLRIFIITLVLSVTADLLLWFVLGPHLPPGRMSSSAVVQQGAIKLMAVMSAPVFVFVVVYFIYAMTAWRRRDGDDEDGPPLHGHTRVQTIWIVGTTVIVLALAVFGTLELKNTNGSGSGSGPAPIWYPAGAELTAQQQLAPWTPGKPVVIQVIAQQWRFTFRYPQFGGFETTALAVPLGQWVQFDVTSIDVIHSFWAYQLGVKADANPGVDNIAYTKPQQLGQVTVRCAELCGLWHGAMFDYGKVLTVTQFQAWASASAVHFADVTKLLPAYNTTYDPTQIAKLSKVMVTLGVTGAGGGYYPPQDPVQP